MVSSIKINLTIIAKIVMIHPMKVVAPSTMKHECLVIKPNDTHAGGELRFIGQWITISFLYCSFDLCKGEQLFLAPLHLSSPCRAMSESPMESCATYFFFSHIYFLLGLDSENIAVKKQREGAGGHVSRQLRCRAMNDFPCSLKRGNRKTDESRLSM